MGNRFTRAAPTNEIDNEKQQTQQPVEEAEEVKIMVYSPKQTGMEEGNLKPIKWAPISPLNGIEEEKNGRNGNTPAKKLEQMSAAKQNGYSPAAGSSKMPKKMEPKNANGHMPGPSTANGTNGNANGISARPQRRRAAKAAATNRQKEMNAGVGRGRPGTKLTGRQLRMLENSYKTTQYLALPSRIKLAGELGMTEKEVKQWYANRRRQSKKQMKAIRAANEKRAAWQMEEDEAEEEEEMDEEFEEASSD